MSLDDFYVGHFDREIGEMLRFWTRLDRPSFQGKKVLDFGCGLGAMCVDISGNGAERVVGLDIQKSLIEFARSNVSLRYPQFENVTKFYCADIANLPETDFDIIISKDVFEHVQGADGLKLVLEEMKKRLRDNGRLYLGWGPLWYSPFGDHKLSKELLPFGNLPIPWGHLLVTETFLLKRVNKCRNENYKSINEYGLNKLPYKYYERLIYNCGLGVLSYGANVTSNPLRHITSALRAVPFLTNYLTSTVYCILEKNGRVPEF